MNGSPHGVDRDPTAAEVAQLRADGYLIVRDYFALDQAADLVRYRVVGRPGSAKLDRFVINSKLCRQISGGSPHRRR